MAPKAADASEKNGSSAIEDSIKDNPRSAAKEAQSKATAEAADEEDEEDDDEDFVSGQSLIAYGTDAESRSSTNVGRK